MTMPCFDTVILSDLHLGSEVSRAKDALQALKAMSFRRLILLGDIFCDLNFRRLNKEHWQFLSYIRKLSNPKREIETVWIEGNHDHGLSEVMSHLVGIRVYEEYEWEYSGMSHLAVHGHQFDRFVVNNRWASGVLIRVHEYLQKFSFGKKRIVGFLERFDTNWLRLSSKVCAGAIEHAQKREVSRIFCGHTHEALHVRRDGVAYYNSGSWTQAKATFITIDAQGVTIHEYDERTNSHYPGEERGKTHLETSNVSCESRFPRDAEYESVLG